MKKLIYFFGLFFVFISCEKPSECIESSGKTITKEIAVSAFNRVEVYRGIELIITQGADYKVEIETGENLIGDIEVTQSGNILKLIDNSTCNWVRQYGQTKVKITAPNIEELYSKSDRNIRSNGILNYPILRLFSLDKDGDGKDGAGTSDFILNLNTTELVIQTNTVSRFFISGEASFANFNFYAGDPRIEAQNLTVQNMTIYHRGSNDMIVKPTQNISGKLLSTGNVILKNNPTNNTLVSYFTGHVIVN
jgi:Putative auto-transporter adhesin, head GIN domain